MRFWKEPLVLRVGGAASDSGLWTDGILDRTAPKRTCCPWRVVDRLDGIGGMESTEDVDELDDDEPRRDMSGGASE
jgi:hypothetical protein